MRGAGEAVYEYIRELHGGNKDGFATGLIVGCDVFPRVMVEEYCGVIVVIIYYEAVLAKADNVSCL